MKKFISIFMAVLFIFSFATMAFADEEKYDYASQPWYTALNNNDEGAWGSRVECYYRILNGKYYSSHKNVATEPDGTTSDLVDSKKTTHIGNEAIELVSFYVYKCDCGNVIGGNDVRAIYSGCSGVCPKCDKSLKAPKLPDSEDGVKIYRYVIIKPTSEHLDTHRDIDYASKNTVFAETAANYGDGEDLPMSFLTFYKVNNGVATTKPEAANLTEAKTSGINLPTFNSILAQVSDFYAIAISYVSYNVITEALDSLKYTVIDAILGLLQ